MLTPEQRMIAMQMAQSLAAKGWTVIDDTSDKICNKCSRLTPSKSTYCMYCGSNSLKETGSTEVALEELFNAWISGAKAFNFKTLHEIVTNTNASTNTCTQSEHTTTSS